MPVGNRANSPGISVGIHLEIHGPPDKACLSQRGQTRAEVICLRSLCHKDTGGTVSLNQVVKYTGKQPTLVPLHKLAKDVKHFIHAISSQV